MIEKNPVNPEVKQITYVIEIDDEEKVCIMNTPNFDQMLQAMSMIKGLDNYHYMKAGKSMINLCGVSYDEAFENDNNNMASLALEICIDLVAPQMVEVKKK